MSKAVKIEAQLRDESKNPRQIRQSGFLPATVYGKGVDSISIQLETKPFLYDYAKDTEAVFELNVDKKSYKTIVANLEKNYSTKEYMNVEFKLV